MNISDYQERAHSTAIYPEAFGVEYAITSLAGEVGELFDLLYNAGLENLSCFISSHSMYAKSVRGNTLHANQVRPCLESLPKELGDVLWHLSEAAFNLDLSFSELFVDPDFSGVDKHYNEQLGIRMLRDLDLLALLFAFARSVSSMSARLSKIIRDDIKDAPLSDALTESHKEALCDDLRLAVHNFAPLVVLMGQSHEAVAQQNLDKLADRQARDVLGGSGDSR